MEIIPLITLEKRRILETNQKTTETKKIDQINEDEKVYVLDKDGIEKDKPNLCLFQKTAGTYSLWIDSGPVELGDIVDSFMAGASTITVRKNLWSKLDLEKIREITENEIFLQIDLRDADEIYNNLHVFEKADGIVIFNDINLIESDSKYASILRKISDLNKTYAYESDTENLFFWQNKGINGLLVDMKKLEEFKNKWNLMQK
jgi:hypothetical protein